MKRTLALIFALIMLLSCSSCLTATAEAATVVQNGLVAHYDGVNNTKNGHDASSTVWYDLVGGHDLPVAKNSTNFFTDNAFRLSNAAYSFPSAITNCINGRAFTVDLVLGDIPSASNTFAPFINNDSNDNFSLFWRKDGDFLEFKSASNNRPKVTGGLDYFKNSTVTVTFDIAAKKCILYCDGLMLQTVTVSSLVGSDGSLTIGNAKSNRYFTADYRAIRFYNRALTPDEVMQNVRADGNDANGTVAYTPFANPLQPSTNIIGDIALVSYVESADELGALKAAEVKPSTAIFYVSSSLRATDSEGKNDFASVPEIIDALGGEVIASFKVADEATARALAEQLDGELYYDAAVISESADAVLSGRRACGKLRGILDLTVALAGKSELSRDELSSIRAEANSHMAKTVILPSSLASVENVKYLRERFITVWIESTSKPTKTEMASMLVSGAFGIISNNTAELYSLASELLPKNTMTRPILNVGHRGIPTNSSYPENTIESGRAAYEAGAFALEIDIYVTSDGELVIYHDSKTNLCTEAISVESSTLARLKQLKYKGFESSGITIPTLREYFEAFKNDDVMFFIEFKTKKEVAVTKLMALIEEYGFYDRCNIIAFASTGLLDDFMAKYPEMTVGYLISNDSKDILSAQLAALPSNGTYNGKMSYTSDFVRAANLRGIMTNVWTVTGVADIINHLNMGVSSLTGNDASVLGNCGFYLTASSKHVEGRITVNAELQTYNRKTLDVSNSILIKLLEGEDMVESVEGNVITLKEGATGTVSYTVSYLNTTVGTRYTLFAEVGSVTVEPSASETGADETGALTDDVELPEGGCGSVVSLSFIAIFGAALVFSKRK